MHLRSPYRWPLCLWRTYLRPSHYYYLLRHWYERARYGYSSSDLWSFDYHIARMLIRALPHYTSRHPYVVFELHDEDCMWSDLPEDEQEAARQRWDRMVDEMVRSLKWYYVDDCEGENPYMPESHDRVRRAMHQFADHFGAFWT